MQNYELTIVMPGKVTPAKKKDAVKFVESLVKTSKGEVENQKDWGTLELAYPIKKNKSASFMLFNVNLPKSSTKDVNDKLRVQEQFIRYLLVKAEN